VLTVFIYFLFILTRVNEFVTCSTPQQIGSVIEILRRHAVAQLVEAPEGRGFDFRLGQRDFSFRPHYDNGAFSASNEHDSQGYLLGKGG
jgi:hypothetical protein